MASSTATRGDSLRDSAHERQQDPPVDLHAGNGRVVVAGMPVCFPFDSASAIAVCRRFLEQDIACSRLTASFRAYYLLRQVIPLAVRQQLQHWRNSKLCRSGDWYLPRDFCDRLSAALANAPEHATALWPENADYAFVLTHDVETAAGLKNVDAIATLEEEVGFRSSWNIVPYKYPIDRGLIHDLKQRGFEIGIHGYNHDGRLFWSKSTFQRRVPLINAAMTQYGAVGFRAPMAHRNLKWMQQLNIDYDSSCFDVDPFQAMPGGIGSLWPLVIGNYVELPYTLPQDHTLLIGLGETTDRIWLRKLALIRRMSGMALMLTHPDYLNARTRLDLYRDFLLKVKDAGGYWHALPQAVAKWWRKSCQDGLSECEPIRNTNPTTAVG